VIMLHKIRVGASAFVALVCYAAAVEQQSWWYAAGGAGWTILAVAMATPRLRRFVTLRPKR
jgi:hypothetical protein